MVITLGEMRDAGADAIPVIDLQYCFKSNCGLLTSRTSYSRHSMAWFNTECLKVHGVLRQDYDIHSGRRRLLREPLQVSILRPGALRPAPSLWSGYNEAPSFLPQYPWIPGTSAYAQTQ